MSDLQLRVKELRSEHDERTEAEDRKFDRAEHWADTAIDALNLGEYTLATRLLEIAGQLHPAFKGVKP